MTALAGMQEVLRLEFNTTVLVAGENLEGAVYLDFRALPQTPLEEVTVTFQGRLKVGVTPDGYATNYRTVNTMLVKQSLSLWKKGSTYPPPGKHILKFPFRFALPRNLYPSCEYSDSDATHSKRGSIGYAVIVVGKRSGFHMNKTIVCPVPVLPSHEQGAALRDGSRVVGFPGMHSYNHWEKQIRRGFWGGFSKVDVTLTLPEIEFFPIFTPIPFSVKIVTTTKVVKRGSTSPGQHIFPSPPKTPTGIDFFLSRHAIVLDVDNYLDLTSDNAGALGGMGRRASREEQSSVRTQIKEAIWVPLPGEEKKPTKQQRGTWTQESVFSSEFVLRCTPTFVHQDFVLKYFLTIRVDFTGIVNGFRADLPIDVVSSFHPPGTGSHWAGPPPDLELPPKYYSADEWMIDSKDME